MKWKWIVFSVVIAISACGKNAYEQFQKGDALGAYKTLYNKAKKKKLERDELSLFKNVISDLILEDSISFHRLIDYKDLDGDKKAYDLFVQMDERAIEIDELRYVLPNYSFLHDSIYDGLSLRLCEALFELASVKLEQTENTGEKYFAREAYEILQDMTNYHTALDYPLDESFNRALILGTEHLLVSLEENVFSYSWEIDRYLDFDDLNLRDGNWKAYHERRQDGIIYDKMVDLIVEDARFYDNVNSSSEAFTERVIVSYNTETDTSGNTIKTPVYGNVQATVFSDERTKSLRIEGEVEVRVWNGNRYDEDIREEYYEQIRTYRISGDERAVPDNIKREINKSESYSSDDFFFRKAMDAFMDEAKDIIEDL